MRLVITVLACLTVLAYWPAMHGPFVYDDAHFVQNNPTVDMRGPVHVSESRALALLSYRINYLFAGNAPFSYHLTNLGIHLLNGLLVWRLAAALGFDPEFAMLILGLFWLHPMQSQAVIYITARAELLATFGILLSMVGIVSQTRWRWPIAGAGLLIGVMSKETALVTPLLWCAWLIYSGESLRRLFVPCGIGVAFILANPSIGRHVLTFMADAHSWPLQAYAVMDLASRFVYPFRLAIDHDFFKPNAILVNLSILGYGGLLSAGVMFRRYISGWGALWFVILTLPHIFAETEGYLAEHHFYAVSFGVFCMIACAIQKVWNVQPRLDPVCG